MSRNKCSKTRTELLPPARQAPADMATVIAKMVEQKVAEAMATEAGALFEPFMQSKEVFEEFRKHQTVIEQRKWTYYFEEWGCLVCEQKDRRHQALGMCDACFSRTRSRMIATLRRANAARPIQEEPKDLEALAQEALVPSIAVLAKRRPGRPTSKAWRLAGSKSEQTPTKTRQP